MPSCCEPGDLDDMFGPSRAKSDARGYLRRGLGGQSRRIFDALRPRVSGRSVLEVGGGIGALQIELLRAGAARMTNVELSHGYEDVARDLLARSGLSDHVERRIADFVADASNIDDADIVILDRVVCCYPDANALVGAAAGHARETLALTFPVDRPYMRAGGVLVNLWPRLVRSRFRFFVHPTAIVRRAAEQRGLRIERHTAGLVWQVLVFTRTTAAVAAAIRP